MAHPPAEAAPGAASAPAGEAAHARGQENGRGADRGSDLEAVLRPAWADVDLDALAANYRALARRLGEAGIVAVVKADAYGHGAPRVARVLEELGARLTAVALLEEGAQLRRAGVELPILALGPASEAQPPLYRRYRILPTVSSLEQLALWRRWAASLAPGERQPLHLKVDTGMTRLGVGLDEVGEALETLRGEPRLELAGVLSHFAEAEDLESPWNRRQEERFAAVLGMLTEAERRRLAVHLANSAAALHRPASRFDLVRLGLALYGLDPAGEAGPAAAELEPVMAVKARVVSVRQVEPGVRLGYGGRWTARRPSRIAVVPVGYADGYPWRLTGTAEALVGGRRVAVVGAVSMDLTMLDVTEVRGAGGAPVAVGEEAVLLGRQGEASIRAPELAEKAGTLPYEILCGLGQRLPRRYLRGGRLDGVASALVRDGGHAR
jgi:alanine racemase